MPRPTYQTREDRFIRFRILENLVKASRAHWDAAGRAASGTLPYVTAAVLHTGKRPWRRVPEIRDLLGDVPPGARTEHYLEFPFSLIDLAAIREEELAGTGLPALRAIILFTL
jgi:hypothetical protein